MIYKKRDALFYYLISAFCVTYFILSLQIPIGTTTNPKSGFFPTILSAIGALISLGLGTQELFQWFKLKKMSPSAISSMDESDETGHPGVDINGKSDWLKLALYVACILFFIVFAEIIGSYICIFILVFSISKVQKLKGFVKPLLMSTITTISFFLLFNVLLGLPLPTGFFI